MVTLLARSPSISVGGSGSWGTLHQQLSISPAASAGNLHKVAARHASPVEEGPRPAHAARATGRLHTDVHVDDEVLQIGQLSCDKPLYNVKQRGRQ